MPDASSYEGTTLAEDLAGRRFLRGGAAAGDGLVVWVVDGPSQPKNVRLDETLRPSWPCDPKLSLWPKRSLCDRRLSLREGSREEDDSCIAR